MRSQDCGGSLGSAPFTDVVSGEISMASESVAGVMSASACRTVARVCIPVEVFAVCTIGVSILVNGVGCEVPETETGYLKVVF